MARASERAAALCRSRAKARHQHTSANDAPKAKRPVRFARSEASWAAALGAKKDAQAASPANRANRTPAAPRTASTSMGAITHALQARRLTGPDRRQTSKPRPASSDQQN